MNQLALELPPTDKEYHRIALTQHQFALVDDKDYENITRFKWRAAWNNEIQSFYAIRSVPRPGKKDTSISMHRQIMQATNGVMIDHRNHDTLDNRRQNLRVATNAQNQYNVRAQRRNRCGMKGAHWNTNMKQWGSRISVEGQRKHLGYFDTAEAAHEAYAAAAQKMHGEFCCAQSRPPLSL